MTIANEIIDIARSAGYTVVDATATQTMAEQFSEKMGNDGMRFKTEDGVSFECLADEMGATVTYSARDYANVNDDNDGNYVLIDGYKGGYIAGEPIRYEFSDGSAVVSAGGGWDIEGARRYSWAGA